MTDQNRIDVYSGTRATGRLHLGNYLGMVKGALGLQEKHRCVFSVVDLHAVTTPFDPKSLAAATLDVVLDYLAAGLDPSKALIEIQSLVPQHTELAYLLGTLYPVSRLEDLPTYKEKKAQHPDYVNLGLLYYPILMAADVLLYKARLVPVGKDQEPHLEVMREIARSFNRRFGQTFPEPQRVTTRGESVPSLDGEGKMAKSKEGSYINLTDPLELIRAKIAKIPTDQGGPGAVPRSGPVTNLFALIELFSGREVAAEYKKEYQKGTLRYDVLKKRLSLDIFRELEPIQNKRRELEAKTPAIQEMLADHAEKLKKIAEETIREVRGKMGFLPQYVKYVKETP